MGTAGFGSHNLGARIRHVLQSRKLESMFQSPVSKFQRLESEFQNSDIRFQDPESERKNPKSCSQN